MKVEGSDIDLPMGCWAARPVPDASIVAHGPLTKYGDVIEHQMFKNSYYPFWLEISSKISS